MAPGGWAVRGARRTRRGPRQGDLPRRERGSRNTTRSAARRPCSLLFPADSLDSPLRPAAVLGSPVGLALLLIIEGQQPVGRCTVRDLGEDFFEQVPRRVPFARGQ